MKKLLITTLAIVSATIAVSAPFKTVLNITNSKGKEVKIAAEGDEFDAVFETLDGYTVLTKDNTAYYYYAIKNGKSLKISDVEVGEETATIPSSLTKHLRDTSDEHNAEVQKRIAEDEAINHTQENWENLKKETDVVDTEVVEEITNDIEEVVIEEKKEEKNWFLRIIDIICSMFRSSDDSKTNETKTEVSKIPLGVPPKTHTVGDIVGLTIMVDFPIKGSSETLAQRKHPDVTWYTVNNSINGKGTSTILHNPSVREFYYNYSCGKLNLTNIVINYVLLDKPRSYYDDVTKKCGECGRLLIKDTFTKLTKSPNYKSEIYPLLQKLTCNSKKQIYSLSVLFAGGSASKWSYGLWAHKSSIGSLPTIISEDGIKMKFSTYQISDIWDFDHGTIYTGTFIHESGHMVCSFPDLYDYDHKSRGAGYYSYMASGDVADAYLAYKAGWIDPIEISANDMDLTLPADYKTVYKYTNPNSTKEYYLIKYCNGTGLDAYLPGKGILIARCYESGSNTHSSFIGKGSNNNKYRRSYEYSIVQADGEYDLERKGNSGEEKDFWSKPNEIISDYTVPNLQWRNNKDSHIVISNFVLGSDTATCHIKIDLPQIKVVSEGFVGKYDKRTHKIKVTKIDPKTGVAIKYSKTKDGTYSSTNPSYKNRGEYITYFMATKKDYMTTNGFERIIIE